MAAGDVEVERNGKNSSVFVSYWEHRTAPSSLALTTAVVFLHLQSYSLFSKYPLSMILLYHKPSNVMLSFLSEALSRLVQSCLSHPLPFFPTTHPSDKQLQPHQPPCFPSEALSILPTQGFALASPSCWNSSPHLCRTCFCTSLRSLPKDLFLSPCLTPL